jgi:hypothetical protein
MQRLAVKSNCSARQPISILCYQTLPPLLLSVHTAHNLDTNYLPTIWAASGQVRSAFGDRKLLHLFEFGLAFCITSREND